MNVYYTRKATKVLDAKLRFLKGPGSRNLVDAIAGEIAAGNDRDRLAGLDRFGRTQPAVKKRRGKYRGATGPPTAPFGLASRVITHFRSQRFGKAGTYRIVAGWENVVSKSGYPFLVSLDRGVTRTSAGLAGRTVNRLKRLVGAGGWLIPPRPIFGISPRTWQRINKRLADFKTKFRKVN